MTLIQIIILAIVQGITEFLPVSSSGHLVLVPKLIGWKDQGIIFDIAVHLGSLGAVCIYFRGDIVKLFVSFSKLLTFKVEKKSSDLLFLLLIATLPAAIVGFFSAEWIEMYARNPLVIAFTLCFYGLLMLIADKKGKKEVTISEISYSHALVIGLAQVLALIPGTSRSGVTMTAGLFLGMKRFDAAKFSFLMSVPVIILASVYKLLVIFLENIYVNWGELFLGMVVSMCVAYASIGFFMSVIQRVGFIPFFIYRMALSVIIIWVFF
ncbi:MAG: undecaprenyl-diphosphatase [Woeseiaceae bacterium]|nr:undecaprenyl-diphosphatase [Woeseiaceae bacterium]